MVTIKLKKESLELLISALDSHVYWQLSDPLYRDDGNVRDPGSDDKDNAAEIRRSRRLESDLSRTLAAAVAVGAKS
jgi:hypothetical protein